MRKAYTFTTNEEMIFELQKLSKDTRIPVARYLEEAIQDLFKKYNREIVKEIKTNE